MVKHRHRVANPCAEVSDETTDPHINYFRARVASFAGTPCTGESSSYDGIVAPSRISNLCDFHSNFETFHRFGILFFATVVGVCRVIRFGRWQFMAVAWKLNWQFTIKGDGAAKNYHFFDIQIEFREEKAYGDLKVGSSGPKMAET